jgi:hypothetical protein
MGGLPEFIQEELSERDEGETMNQANVKETKKVTREEALEMVRDTKAKLLKLLFDPDMAKIYTEEFFIHQFNARIYTINIWLDRYAANFNKEISIESDETKEAGIGTIHNENLGINYRENFLTNIAARLIKYGSKATNGEEAHALIKALDEVYEAIGFIKAILN